jgi:predicted enzyme related to lactoylglutathione lyase
VNVKFVKTCQKELRFAPFGLEIFGSLSLWPPTTYSKIMITEIAFTGTPVTDIKRAREFYEGALGLKPAMEGAGGLWVEYEIGQGTFAIGCYGEVWKPSPDGTCVAFEVDNLDGEVARLKSSGVKFSLETTDSPVCRFAIVCDPDGNKIMIHKRNAT